uniref:Ribosome receptor lysine/proline rich domain-containing protein n=1 Tax=Dendroctonus ponderosae TaxID=77166 RepID=A0AAR5PAN6_DENPD
MDTNAVIGSIVFVLMTGCVTMCLTYFYYGGRSKSYEELWEENKQLQAANRNLVQSAYAKPKEKKNKKAKKGNKNNAAPTTEEASSKEASWETIEDSPEPEEAKPQAKPKLSNNNSAAKPQTKQSKSHVVFVENTTEVPIEKELASKKRAKRVRSILDKKSSKTEIILPVIGTTPVANHFEDTQPKDEIMLLISSSKIETKAEKAPKKNKQTKPEVQPVEKNNAAEQPEVILEKEKIKEEVVLAVVQEPAAPAASIGKEKKKKKSEFNPKQPIPGDKIIEAIRNSEISHTESQLLVDLILNKQQEHSIITDEWSEGKSDPVQKLKKQLAEREKQVAEGQEALTAVQAKLKEIRMEQQSEKSQLLQLLNSSSLRQKRIQELEDLRNADSANFEMVVEENKALKMQMNQLEAAMITLQETDAHFKAENLQLGEQLQLLTRQRKEQDTNYQNLLIKLQALESNHSYALSAAQEETRRLSEQLMLTTSTLAQEEHKNEMIAQLQSELLQLKEERCEQINGSTEVTKNQEVQILNLTTEISFLKLQLTKFQQSLHEEEAKYLEDQKAADQKCKLLESEIEEHRSKNDQLRKKNWKLVEALKAAESRNATECHKSTQVEVHEAVDTHQNNTAEMVKLKLQADHYRNALDESVTTLNALQDQIVAEESTWRSLLAEKDEEIRDLKTQCIPELENKISTLESQLAGEHENLNVAKPLNTQPHTPENNFVSRQELDATCIKLSSQLKLQKEFLENESSQNNDVANCLKVETRNEPTEY